MANDQVSSTEAEKRKGANPSRSKNVLGRGLSALMSAGAVDVEPSKDSLDRVRNFRDVSRAQDVLKSDSTDAKASAIVDADTPPEGGLVYLNIERLRRNHAQPRQHFAQEEIDSLSESIKQSGLLQPVIVRRRAGEVGPLASYEIVAGERRWRAAKAAGLQRVPALVRQLDDKETLELGIIENVQRSDLNPVEEAQAYNRLIKEFGASQEEVAQSVGKDRTSIANALRLLKLEPAVQQLVIEKVISAGHGRALLMCADAKMQLALAKRIENEALSVRQTEQLAKGLEIADPTASKPEKSKSKKPSKSSRKKPAVVALEERIRRVLGTKVNLELDQEGAGELHISFFSQDELDSFIEKIGA